MATEQAELQIILKVVSNAKEALDELAARFTELSGQLGKVGKSAEGLGEVGEHAHAVGQHLEETGEHADTLLSKFNELREGALLLVKSFLALEAVRLFREFAEEQAAIEVMVVGMKNIGEAAGYTSEQMTKLVKDLQEFDITKGVAAKNVGTLIANQLSPEKISEIGAAARKLALESGRSVDEVFTVLARAVATGQTRLLTRQFQILGKFDATQALHVEAQRRLAASGSSFISASERPEITAGAIVRRINERVPETAIKEGADTAEGRLKHLGVVWKEFKESLGEGTETVFGGVIAGLTAIVEAMKEFVESLGKGTSVSKTLGEAMRSLGEAIAGAIKFVTAHKDAIKVLAEFVGILIAFDLAGWFLKVATAGAGAAGIATFGTALKYVVQMGLLAGGPVRAALAGLTFTVRTLFVALGGWVTVAALVITGLIELYNRSSVVQAAIKALGTAFVEFGDWLWDTVVTRLKLVVDGFRSLWEAVATRSTAPLKAFVKEVGDELDRLQKKKEEAERKTGARYRGAKLTAETPAGPVEPYGGEAHGRFVPTVQQPKREKTDEELAEEAARDAANAKAIADNRLKIAEAALAEEKRMAARAQADDEFLMARGLIAVENFYQHRLAAVKAGLDAELAVNRAQRNKIDAEEAAYRASPAFKGGATADARITEFQTQRQALLAKDKLARAKANDDEVKLVETGQTKIRDLERKASEERNKLALKDTTDLGARLEQIRAKYEKLNEEAGDNERLKAANALNEAYDRQQAGIETLTARWEQYKNVQTAVLDLQTAEVALAQKTFQLTSLGAQEANNAILERRIVLEQQHLQELENLRQHYVAEGAAGVKAAKDTEVEMLKTRAAILGLQQQIKTAGEEIAKSFSDNLTGTLDKIIERTEHATQAWKDFGRALVATITHKATTGFAESITNALAGGGTKGGEPAGGGIFGFVGGLLGGGGKKPTGAPGDPLEVVMGVPKVAGAADATTKLADKLESTSEKQTSSLSEALSGLGDKLSTLFNDLVTAITSMIGSTSGGAAGGGSGLLGLFSGLFGGGAGAGAAGAGAAGAGSAGAGDLVAGATVLAARGGKITPFGLLRHLAEGGPIVGPGTGTSDSVPIMASHGEFIMNADATKRYEPLLHAMNDGRLNIGFGGARKMAAGGAVAGGHAAMPAPQVHVTHRIVNVIDPKMAKDYMQSSDGEQVMLNFIRRNAGSVQQLLATG
jgi:hypothetical protein